MSLHALQAYISSIVPIQEEDWAILTDCINDVTFRKNEFLLKEGQVCHSIFFVVEGSCKAFYNVDGREVNTAFYFEQEFATNIKSLRTGAASEYSIKACERTIAVKIDKEKLLQSYARSHQIEAFGRKVLELIIAKQEEHADSFKVLSPRERYDALVRKQPDFLQRVSLTQTASYLGISRETLSRYRASR